MSPYQEIALERGTRHFLCSDIHGHYTELMNFLDSRKFADSDFLYLLGDSIDRGKENLEMVELMKSKNVRAIAGNHELALLDFVDGRIDSDAIIRKGGYWFTLLDENARQAVAETFRALPIAMKLITPAGRTRGLVHAACYPDDWNTLAAALRDNESRRTRTVINSVSDRAKFNRGEERTIENINYVVVGHNPTSVIGTLGNTIYIDCGLYLDGELKMIDAITLKQL